LHVDEFGLNVNPDEFTNLTIDGYGKKFHIQGVVIFQDRRHTCSMLRV